MDCWWYSKSCEVAACLQTVSAMRASQQPVLLLPESLQPLVLIFVPCLVDESLHSTRDEYS